MWHVSRQKMKKAQEQKTLQSKSQHLEKLRESNSLLQTQLQVEGRKQGVPDVIRYRRQGILCTRNTHTHTRAHSRTHTYTHTRVRSSDTQTDVGGGLGRWWWSKRLHLVEFSFLSQFLFFGFQRFKDRQGRQEMKLKNQMSCSLGSNCACSTPRPHSLI